MPETESHILILGDKIKKAIIAADKMTQVETGEAYGQFVGLGIEEAAAFESAKGAFADALSDFVNAADSLEAAGNGLAAYLPPE